jgi:hypothetical protein
MNKRAIFRYKHKDGELDVKVLESPKIISTMSVDDKIRYLIDDSGITHRDVNYLTINN